jgi:hypothetical protein
MNDFSVEIDDSKMEGMKSFMLEYPRRIQRAMRRTANTGKEWIVRDTPFQFGAAARSWEVNEVEEYWSFVIASITGAGAKYTPYLEEGTGIYGPLQKEIIAAEVTKSGGPFFWVSMGKSRGKGKGKIMYYTFSKKSKGMPGAHMVGRNIPGIEQILNENVQHEFEKANKQTGGEE